MEKLYKVTGPNGEALHGGTGCWHLPIGKRPGKWMPPVKGVLRSCSNGYHLATVEQVLPWCYGEGFVLWEAEARGHIVDAGDKTVAESARLIKPVPVGWRLLASDFAAHVHLYWDSVYPKDSRPREAIITARSAADSAAASAASSAASSAARLAARLAARSEAYSAADSAASWAASLAADSAAHSASAAASAASSAARLAARSEAYSAEGKWQTKHFLDVLAGRKQPGRVRITMAAK
jgi:hypothetical protein